MKRILIKKCLYVKSNGSLYIIANLKIKGQKFFKII